MTGKITVKAYACVECKRSLATKWRSDGKVWEFFFFRDVHRAFDTSMKMEQYATIREDAVFTTT